MSQAVNSEPKSIYGVAKGVRVNLGTWTGLMDFSIVPMDDYPIVLGMEFLDRVQAVLCLFPSLRRRNVHLGEG